MKKSLYILFVFLVSASTFSQSKKWTLEECVDYAYKNNISVKLSELDSKNSLISKDLAIGRFLPTINANAQHSWNIGLNRSEERRVGKEC